jgi:hypothetical protein
MTKGWENRENDYDPKISHWDGTPYLQHGGALDSFVGWITLLSSVKKKEWISALITVYVINILVSSEIFIFVNDSLSIFLYNN